LISDVKKGISNKFSSDITQAGKRTGKNQTAYIPSQCQTCF